jgi:hypothetical protein
MSYSAARRETKFAAPLCIVVGLQKKKMPGAAVRLEQPAEIAAYERIIMIDRCIGKAVLDAKLPFACGKSLYSTV